MRNWLKSLQMDHGDWHANYKVLEKEKIYKNRKIHLIVKEKDKKIEGNFLIMSYGKEMSITEDEIIWKIKPKKTYTSIPFQFVEHMNANLLNSDIQRDLKNKMEKLFQHYFIEKKEKLKFIK